MFSGSLKPNHFQVLLLFFFIGCTSQPHEETKKAFPTQQEVLSPIESIPVENISATATVSAQMKWCGYEYQNFYLASMQFERLTPRPKADYAYLGVYHGTMLQTELSGLERKSCTERDVENLKVSYASLLKTWCSRKAENASIEKICNDGNVFKK